MTYVVLLKTKTIHGQVKIKKVYRKSWASLECLDSARHEALKFFTPSGVEECSNVQHSIRVAVPMIWYTLKLKNEWSIGQ